MTHDEILQQLYDHTLVGNAPEVKDLVNQGLEDGMDPEKLLYDALIPSLEEVGARFERGDFFVPEMLIAARAMQGALDILRPLLADDFDELFAVWRRMIKIFLESQHPKARAR